MLNILEGWEAMIKPKGWFVAFSFFKTEILSAAVYISRKTGETILAKIEMCGAAKASLLRL